MTDNHRARISSAGTFALRATLVASVAALVSACASAPAFETPDASFNGSVSVVDTPVVVPGTAVQLAGKDFKPGQEVRLSYGGAALNSQPIVVGADGSFRTQIQVPANAPVGQQPVVVSVSKPAAALVQAIKVSPNIPVQGADRFTATSQKLVPGLYQSAYSAKTDRIFVTSAVGRPPVSQSALVKLNAQTLAIEARAVPAKAPAGPARAGEAPRDPGVFAVYGVAVDDVNGNVWVTNTRQNTVAVYRQSDLSLVKQFPPGAVNHARDVVVDAVQGKVYASATGTPNIAVFDAKTLAQQPNIEIATTVRGPNKSFSPMSLELDAANGKLYTVSMGTNEAAVIDTRAGKVEKVFVVDGAKGASGVAFDAKTSRLLVASQTSDNLVIVDAASGKTLHDVKVGAGPLNVAVDHARGLAYVPSRASGTVTVVTLDGKIFANLPNGNLPNHVTEDGKGSIFAINKARGTDDATGDSITRLTPR